MFTIYLFFGLGIPQGSFCNLLLGGIDSISAFLVGTDALLSESLFPLFYFILSWFQLDSELSESISAFPCVWILQGEHRSTCSKGIGVGFSAQVCPSSGHQHKVSFKCFPLLYLIWLIQRHYQRCLGSNIDYGKYLSTFHVEVKDSPIASNKNLIQNYVLFFHIQCCVMSFVVWGLCPDSFSIKVAAMYLSSNTIACTTYSNLYCM